MDIYDPQKNNKDHLEGQFRIPILEVINVSGHIASVSTMFPIGKTVIYDMTTR